MFHIFGSINISYYASDVSHAAIINFKFPKSYAKTLSSLFFYLAFRFISTISKLNMTLTGIDIIVCLWTISNVNLYLPDLTSSKRFLVAPL